MATKMTDYHKLVKYAESLGYRVIESDCDSWHYGTKIICNNKRRKTEYRIIYLLHECGHARLVHDLGIEYMTLYSGLYDDTKNKKLSEFEQECNAWDRGFVIAKELNISFDLKVFSKIKMQCLKGYL